MPERRYTLVFYAAVFTAVLATFGVYRVLEAAKAGSRVPMRAVVVAAQDVPEGASLDRRALTVTEWPVPTVPAGAYAAVDSVAGRVTRVAVFKGEPLVPGRLAPVGTGPGLEVKIAPGKRAMALKIDDVAGISGLIQPNSRVDVLVTLGDGAERERRVAKLFMENMRVLSVGTQVQRGRDDKPIAATSATIEVTPDEAERLAVASREGSIQLVLRGYGDPDSIKTTGARTNDVLAQLRNAPEAQLARAVRPGPRAPARSRPQPVRAPERQVVVTPPPAVPPDSLTVQVFRGDKVSQQKFEQKDQGAAPRGTPPGTP